jgi:antirestriction protein ArdC
VFHDPGFANPGGTEAPEMAFPQTFWKTKFENGAGGIEVYTGIPFEEMRHPEYINSWLQILKNDTKAIFTAAAKALTAADFILDRAGLTVTDDQELPAAA